MLYALYIGFIGVFVAIAAAGHILLLMALYPNMFGNPGPATNTWPGFGGRLPAEPPAHPVAGRQEPRLAA